MVFCVVIVVVVVVVPGGLDGIPYIFYKYPIENMIIYAFGSAHENLDV